MIYCYYALYIFKRNSGMVLHPSIRWHILGSWRSICYTYPAMISQITTNPTANAAIGGPTSTAVCNAVNTSNTVNMNSARTPWTTLIPVPREKYPLALPHATCKINQAILLKSVSSSSMSKGQNKMKYFSIPYTPTAYLIPKPNQQPGVGI